MLAVPAAINIIKKGGFLPVMVIANWGKNKK